MNEAYQTYLPKYNLESNKLFIFLSSLCNPPLTIRKKIEENPLGNLKISSGGGGWLHKNGKHIKSKHVQSPKKSKNSYMFSGDHRFSKLNWKNIICLGGGHQRQ